MSAIDPGAQPAQEPTTTEAPSSGPDLSPIYDRLDQITGNFGQLAEQFQGFIQAQQPAEEQPDMWAGLWEDPNAQQDPGVDPYGNPVQPVQQQPQINPQALQQAVNQAIQQSNAPLAEQLQGMQRQMALNDLTTRVPALKDPEVARATQERLAQQIGHLPPHVQEALAWDANFIETVFKAAEAERLAAAQEPAGENPTQLETAGGAHPGGTGEEQNFVHRVHATRPGVPRGFM